MNTTAGIMLIMDDGDSTISEAMAMAASQPDYGQLLDSGEPPL